MRIGYAKLQRAWNLSQANTSTIGGDADVRNLLTRMATDRPDDEFYLIGRCEKVDPAEHGFPKNVYNPWFTGELKLNTLGAPQVEKDPALPYRFMDGWREQVKDLKLDALVYWCGQVANSCFPIPFVGDDWKDPLPAWPPVDTRVTNPHVESMNYTSYLLDYVNQTGMEPILICPDPRNTFKPRNTIRPLLNTQLAQADQENMLKHEQYQVWGQPWQEGYERDGSSITSKVVSEYAGIEFTALPHPSAVTALETNDRPHLFGVISNENRAEVPQTKKRRIVIKEYVDLIDKNAPIYGNWTEAGAKALGRKDIACVPYHEMFDVLQSFRFTMTFSASGSGWITAKVWEACACGTPIFIHKDYDTQNHMFKHYGKEFNDLRKFLRVYTVAQIRQRIKKLEDPAFYRDIVREQRALFEKAYDHWDGGALRVKQRLDGQTW